MNNLKWVLLSVCILKIISFSLCIKFNQDIKEINQFSERELFRKYNDHGIEIGHISPLSHQYDVIKRDSTKYFLGNRSEDRRLDIKRTRFQDYAIYLRTIDTLWQSDTEINLNMYPEVLQNTVLEENAKREIYTHFEHLNRAKNSFIQGNLKGMVTQISSSIDSLSINLVPFWFQPHLGFDFCQCGTKTLVTELNPFFYRGSLFSCKCTYQNRVTKEVTTYVLKTK